MSKEGIPAVYEVKGNDHARHISKTAQDRTPVAQRRRVIEWQQRIDAARGKTVDNTTEGVVA